MTSAIDRHCRNVVIGGRRTSLRLEHLYWDALDEVCRREDLTISELLTGLEGRGKQLHGSSLSISSAVRVFVMDYFRSAATEEGHSQARHCVGAPFAGSVLNLAVSGEPSARRDLVRSGRRTGRNGHRATAY